MNDGMPARERVVRALVAIVARSGLDAVSVRHVAAEAGVTGGMVQHHFPTKHAMLTAAMTAVTDQVRARTAAARQSHDPAAALRAVCTQLLPLDATRAGEGRVWLAFLARAAVDEELAAVHRSTWQQLEDLLTDLIAAARGGMTPVDGDRAAAALLLATLDGLATGGLVETTRLAPRRVERLLDAQLAAVLKSP